MICNEVSTQYTTNITKQHLAQHLDLIKLQEASNVSVLLSCLLGSCVGAGSTEILSPQSGSRYHINTDPPPSLWSFILTIRVRDLEKIIKQN